MPLKLVVYCLIPVPKASRILPHPHHGYPSMLDTILRAAFTHPPYKVLLDHKAPGYIWAQGSLILYQRIILQEHLIIPDIQSVLLANPATCHLHSLAIINI